MVWVNDYSSDWFQGLGLKEAHKAPQNADRLTNVAGGQIFRSDLLKETSLHICHLHKKGDF